LSDVNKNLNGLTVFHKIIQYQLNKNWFNHYQAVSCIWTDGPSNFNGHFVGLPNTDKRISQIKWKNKTQLLTTHNQSKHMIALS
jgi:hypothetical protein